MKTLRQCTDRQEWDNYVLENGGHPLQLWGWGELKSAHGWSAERVLLTDDSGEISGAAQVLYRRLFWPFRSIAYIPRGPIITDDNSEELLNLLADHIKKTRHCVALSIEPDTEQFTVPKGWKPSKNRILPSRTILLDLSKSEDSLRAAMETSTRRYIRKAGESGLVIKKIHNRGELDECLDVYQDTAKRAKFNLHSRQYYYDAFEKLGDSAVVFAAYSDEKPVAFLWLAVSANTAFELYGGMNETGKQLGGSYGLKWHAICKSKEWGIARYDFGGLVDGGVTGFKKSWTDTETVFAGTFDRPLSIFYGLWGFAMPIGKSLARTMKSFLGKK